MTKTMQQNLKVGSQSCSQIQTGTLFYGSKCITPCPEKKGATLFLP